MRFSKSIDGFYLLPPSSQSYTDYSSKLLTIAKTHAAKLFIPVSGAGSSVEDARAGEEMFLATEGRCRTFIQDPETMAELHDKDRFMGLVERLGLAVPNGRMVKSVDEAMTFLREDGGGGGGGGGGERGSRGPKYVLKCMGLDENRGDMTLFPLSGDDEKLRMTRGLLEGLKLGITQDCPYVFQEFIPGQGERSPRLIPNPFLVHLG